jgi:hypothetical protein
MYSLDISSRFADANEKLGFVGFIEECCCPTAGTVKESLARWDIFCTSGNSFSMGSDHEIKIKWHSEWTTLIVIGIFVLLALIYLQLQKGPVSSQPPQPQSRAARPDDRLIQNPDNVWYN